MQLVEPRVVRGGVSAVDAAADRVDARQLGRDVVDGNLHAERVEPEVRVLQPVAVALVLLLASGSEVLECLYRIVGLYLSGFKSVEYPKRHGGLFLFADIRRRRAAL